MITMIAAVASNRAIGFQNKLIYWLPNDLKHFKQLTTGNTILMGRRTFESLPKGALPNRRNCVLTTTATTLPGCECFATWRDFLASCSADEDIFIIGGATLYNSLIEKADRLCLTEIHDTPAEADTFFPDYSQWQETWREKHTKDERHGYDYDFVNYEKPKTTARKRNVTMRKFFLCSLLALLAMTTMEGQTYTTLWKQAEEAELNDLPRTQYEVLMKIAGKAQKEGQYGQLMAAELAGSRVMATIAPDSLQPAVKRMERHRRKATDKALAAVYTAVLQRIYKDNSDRLGEPADDLSATLDMETCQRLASVKAADYKPLVYIGRDSYFFDDDMLSVVGYELKDFRPLLDYYSKAGKRLSAMMVDLEIARQKRLPGNVKYDEAPYIAAIDSLIDIYGDMPEAGELGIERYEYMDSHTDATPEQKWNYTIKAIERWKSYRRTNALRNAQMDLNTRMYSATVNEQVTIPGREQKMKIENARNIEHLTMRIYRVRTDGTCQLNPNYENDYKKLKPLLTEMKELQVTHQYSGKKEYELFEDSMEVLSLPVGIYMIELQSKPETKVSRQLYFVSNVRVLSEALPGKKMRYIVVDAIEGQPVKGATIELRGFIDGERDKKIATLTTDDKGEAAYQYEKDRPTNIFVWTNADKFCPPTDAYGNFSYYTNDNRVERIQVFTDRAIYRPGQTVHVAAIDYEVTDGYKQKALKDRKVKLTLYDPNRKVLSEQTLTTDKYGSCETEFTLPSSGLTGSFSIRTDKGGYYFRVEEYKRPTFEVKFDEVTDNYKDGDTITVKATARSYAGVPVQSAKVSYKVVRNRSFWWWSYSSYWNRGTIGQAYDNETVAEGEAMTDGDGTFTVRMPMVLPKTDYPMFYNFVCQADVTDQAGETHEAQLSLPLGNRNTAFGCDMPEQVRADQMPKVTFSLRNAAGNEIDGQAKYRIDNGKWQTVKTNVECAVFNTPCKSGRHTLEAVCEGDTLKQEYTVFSLDDKQPAAETDDWMYQSHTQFPNDGSPVTIQVGSSAQNVHIVYSIISGDRVIESGSAERSNELINRKLTYKEEYGNGLLMTFAWMKRGKCHTHAISISRPLPDKQLKMQWKTFRDRLIPGQQEEWTLTVTKPDGTPADALLMATLYDKSLDQIKRHNWTLNAYQRISLPMTQWLCGSWDLLNLSGSLYQSPLYAPMLDFSRFDSDLFPQLWMHHPMLRSVKVRGRGLAKATMAIPEREISTEEAASVLREVVPQNNSSATVADAMQRRIAGLDMAKGDDTSDNIAETVPEVPLRENLQETAFFYPRLTTDSTGVVTLKFTLPESLTTWRFMGLAHTEDLCHGMLEGEAVARKDIMIQPNMPRFIREGDKTTIAARIINTSDHPVSGTAYLQLIDPATEKSVLSLSEPFSIDGSDTKSVTFRADADRLAFSDIRLLVCKTTAVGDGFSDGEQHYLPVLPATERVTVTVPFTQNRPGTKAIDLTQLFNGAGSSPQLTVEYTNNPAWLIIQSLPTVAHPHDECALCQATSFYANTMGRYILSQNPNVKAVFEQWKHVDVSALSSSLEKNQQLKDILLNETPWVMEAEQEEEQKQRMGDFFDENTMQMRLTSAIGKLEAMQLSNGSWGWWSGMQGSWYMTVEISQLLTRLNLLAGKQEQTQPMLDKAMKYMGEEIVELVRKMKEEERKGYKQHFPSYKALQWLYICAISKYELPTKVDNANLYLKKLLKKDIKNQTIYEKAMSAIILQSPTYVKSLKEHTVYREEAGRYYDTPRASYSWCDYRIPTQVAAIEAIRMLSPTDTATIEEMQRWLLHEKRTTEWSTPINSVNAIHAFMTGQAPLRTAATAVLKTDDKPLALSPATAGVGYVKATLPYQGEKMFSAEKTSEGTSWGAVYAQFMQQMSDIQQSGNGITVKREILPVSNQLANEGAGPVPARNTLKVGERVTIRITIETERDLDFVQVLDKRAACMEPVNQISGFRQGYYCTPKDCSTNYYFDCMSKGKHVIETQYYVDRAGQYETGTCTVQCAYAPEYRATAPSLSLNIK